MTEGKKIPQATDLEEAVLGAMMLEKSALPIVMDILRPESFYLEANQFVFKAIKALYDRVQPVDILTVTNQLKGTKQLELIGGPYFVSQLTNRVASAANVEYHARIIAQKHLERTLISMSLNLYSEATNPSADVFDTLELFEKSLTEISGQLSSGDIDSIQEIYMQARAHTQSLGRTKDGIVGVPSGLGPIDRTTGGWQKGNLIIVAARPGMGKTVFAMNIARNAAVDFKKPGVFFSLEMSKVELMQRLRSAETGIYLEKFIRQGLTQEETDRCDTVCENIMLSPLFIDDSETMTVQQFRSKARKFKRERNIQWIVIDYLQLMKDPIYKGNREQEVSSISRTLKMVAKELEIPVIALSQLSRQTEGRTTKRPQLSDLRESGAIEQDADMVVFIHRPEYYGINEDEAGNSTIGMAEMIFAKHRNGAVCHCDLRFDGARSKFSDANAFTTFEEIPRLTDAKDFTPFGER